MRWLTNRPYLILLLAIIVIVLVLLAIPQLSRPFYYDPVDLFGN